MFMRFVGMGIGHQDGSANASISDDMNCDPDACEESEEYGGASDDEIRQGPNEDVGEGEDEEDTEDERDDEDEDEDEDQDDQDTSSEDDIGYDDL